MFRELTLEEISTHKQELMNNDYTILRKIIKDPDFFTDKITFPDGFPNPKFGRRVSGPGSLPVIKDALYKFEDTIQKITPYVIEADYAFAMHYTEGSTLTSHYDNFNNLISCTAVYKSAEEIYPIYLDKAKFSNPYPLRLVVDDIPGIPPENVARLDIAAGDIGVFKGRYHLHWRNKAPKGTETRAMLLHYNRLKTHYVPRNVNIRYAKDTSDPTLKAHPAQLKSYSKFRMDYDLYFAESML